MNLPLCSHTDKHTHTLECENVCVLCAFPTFETNNFKSICAQMLIAHTEEVFFFENEENAGYFIQINFIFFHDFSALRYSSVLSRSKQDRKWTICVSVEKWVFADDDLFSVHCFIFLGRFLFSFWLASLAHARSLLLLFSFLFCVFFLLFLNSH